MFAVALVGALSAPKPVILVADVSDGFRFLAENDMGERVIASPVPVMNRLLVRGEKHLFCLGKYVMHQEHPIKPTTWARPDPGELTCPQNN